MSSFYKKQTVPRAEKDYYSATMVKKLNTDSLPEFLSELGINITTPGNMVPNTNGVPRVFLMDEKDGVPRTLDEENLRVGTVEFWEAMRQGRMFAFPAGEKEPVQLQVTNDYPPAMAISAPLSKAAEGFDYKKVKEPPKPAAMPAEVRRPGWFSRLMNSINSNWYKAENDAYRKYRQQCDTVRTQNEAKKRDYDEEAARAKKSLEDTGKALGKRIQEAFGNSRSSERDLEIEKINAEEQLESYEMDRIQKKREDQAESARNKETRTEDAVENMMSMYGPKPEALPRLLNICYTQDQLNTLKPFQLPENMKIGETQVDERLFANIALHAQMNHDISRNWFETKWKNHTVEAAQEGLSEKQIDLMAGLEGAGMFVTDAVNDTPRGQYSQFFEIATEPGREAADKALKEYQNGNREPLAQIICNAVNLTVACSKDGTVSTGGLTHAKLTCELLELLKDEKLEEEARKKGLKGKDVKVCRGMDALRKLADNALLADSKLAQAAAENDQSMTAAQKKAYMTDIIKYRTADAILNQQISPKRFPEYAKAEKELDDRMNATSKDMKPLSITARTHLGTLVRTEKIDAPDILQKLRLYDQEERAMSEVGLKPDPNALDKLAEKTVLGMGYDEMDIQELGEHIGSNALSGSSLLLAQDKIAKGENLKKAPAKEIRNELDMTVDYGHGGPEA